MGCKGSKSKKNAYARVAQYQKESWAAERAVRRAPEPLDWGLAPPGCITPAALHNLLTDGFYAPYAANPHYLLLLDCRSAAGFTKRRLCGARWHGALHAAPDPRLVNTIVLYDDRPRTATPPAGDADPLAKLYHELRRQKLQPVVVVGGWPVLEATCPHLLEEGEGPPSEPTPWYPAQVLPRQLYLGHAEMAAHPRVLAELRVTHIVDVTERLPARVLPAMNYLLVPVSEDPTAEGEEGGADLLASLPTIMAFVSEARSLGGSVLVHCDQGLTRAAVVVMGILMAERRCTLEDAFYYVKGARSAVHPSPSLLHQLATYEIELFGASLTLAEDLF